MVGGLGQVVGGIRPVVGGFGGRRIPCLDSRPYNCTTRELWCDDKKRYCGCELFDRWTTHIIDMEELDCALTRVVHTFDGSIEKDASYKVQSRIDPSKERYVTAKDIDTFSIEAPSTKNFGLGDEVSKYMDGEGLRLRVCGDIVEVWDVINGAWKATPAFKAEGGWLMMSVDECLDLSITATGCDYLSNGSAGRYCIMGYLPDNYDPDATAPYVAYDGQALYTTETVVLYDSGAKVYESNLMEYVAGYAEASDHLSDTSLTESYAYMLEEYTIESMSHVIVVPCSRPKPYGGKHIGKRWVRMKRSEKEVFLISAGTGTEI